VGFSDEFVVRRHVVLAPSLAQSPPQPAKIEFPVGFAVSVTRVPLGSLSEHVPVTLPLLIAQLIAGEAEEFDVTVPAPVPTSVTVSE
jgi:hypothetical protein